MTSPSYTLQCVLYHHSVGVKRGLIRIPHLNISVYDLCVQVPRSLKSSPFLLRLAQQRMHEPTVASNKTHRCQAKLRVSEKVSWVRRRKPWRHVKRDPRPFPIELLFRKVKSICDCEAAVLEFSVWLAQYDGVRILRRHPRELFFKIKTHAQPGPRSSQCRWCLVIGTPCSSSTRHAPLPQDGSVSELLGRRRSRMRRSNLCCSHLPSRTTGSLHSRQPSGFIKISLQAGSPLTKDSTISTSSVEKCPSPRSCSSRISFTMRFQRVTVPTLVVFVSMQSSLSPVRFSSRGQWCNTHAQAASP